MEGWIRHLETSIPDWKILSKAAWWAFETERSRVYVLGKADMETQHFAILITDLKAVWMSVGGPEAVQAQHRDYNKGLETDIPGLTAHIDRLISDFRPENTYEFLNNSFKVSTLLGNVYRFQCVFPCNPLNDALTQFILHNYLIGCLFTVIKTQENVIDRQTALIRALEGKQKADLEGDVRRLAQENRRGKVGLGRIGREVMEEMVAGDVRLAEEQVKARETELKRKRAEDAQRQVEGIKRAKPNPPPAPAQYQETEDEVLRRLELAQKLQKPPEAKKKTKRMDFL